MGMITLDPKYIVYELDPNGRYLIDLGPGVTKDELERMTKTLADAGFTKNTMLASGRNMLKVTPVERGVKYLVHISQGTQPDYEMVAKALHNWGVDCLVVDDRFVTFQVDDGGTDVHS